MQPVEPGNLNFGEPLATKVKKYAKLEGCENDRFVGTGLCWDGFIKQPQLPCLDGLRAIAILLVVWHHTGGSVSDFWWLRGGYHGVTLFFGISGFLITFLLERERSRFGRLSLGKFYARRALRIFPLYYIVLGVYCVIVPIMESSELRREGFWGNLPFFLSYSSNWFVGREDGGTVFFFSWSLATEEQYYLVWPVVLLIFSRRIAAAVCLSGLLLGVGVKLVFAPIVGQSAFVCVVLASISPAICIGSLFGLAASSRSGFSWLAFVFSSCVVRFGLVLLALIAVAAELPEAIVGAVLATTVVGLVLGSGVVIKRVLEFPALAWVGQRCYGIYLWHLLCKNAVLIGAGVLGVRPRISGGGAGLFCLTLALSLVVAAVSYRWIESPLLALKKRFHPV